MTATSKRPLQLGDRVKVFCHLGDYKGTVVAVDAISHSRYRTARGLIKVKGDNGEIWTQHPRQCVRLKKKKEKERVERWYKPASSDGAYDDYYTSNPQSVEAGSVHLVELRKGEAIVSREVVRAAFGQCVGIGDLEQFLAMAGLGKQ